MLVSHVHSYLRVQQGRQGKGKGRVSTFIIAIVNTVLLNNVNAVIL